MRVRWGGGSLGQDPRTNHPLEGDKSCHIPFIPELWLLEPGRLGVEGLSPSSWGHLGGLVGTRTALSPQ